MLNKQLELIETVPSGTEPQWKTPQALHHSLPGCDCDLPGWTLNQCLADPAQTDVSEAHMWLWTGWTDRRNDKTQERLWGAVVGDWCHTYRPTQRQLHRFNSLHPVLTCAVAWPEHVHWTHTKTHHHTSNVFTRTAEPSSVVGLG